MKHEAKKHFDVSKPRRKGPDPTSKPIIVGHHPTMPDPMIREEREKAPKPITVVSDGDEPEPLNVTTGNPGPKTDEPPEIEVVKKPEEKPAEESLEVKTDEPPEKPAEAAAAPAEAVATASHIFPPPESPQEEKPVEPAVPASAGTPETPATTEPLPAVPAVEAIDEGAAVTTATSDAVPQPAPAADQPPAPPEPPAGQELHIPAGNGMGHGDAKVRHRPRIWVWIVIGLIVFIWIYAAVDALTNTKLPLEFFENSNQTAQPVTNAPTQSTIVQPNPTPPQATQELITGTSTELSSGKIEYKNQTLNIQFVYPKEWGKVTAKKLLDNIKQGTNVSISFTGATPPGATLRSRDWQPITGRGGVYTDAPTAFTFKKTVLKDGTTVMSGVTVKNISWDKDGEIAELVLVDEDNLKIAAYCDSAAGITYISAYPYLKENKSFDTGNFYYLLNKHSDKTTCQSLKNQINNDIKNQFIEFARSIQEL